MQSVLQQLTFNLGYLKRSEKEKIKAVLVEKLAEEKALLQTRGARSNALTTELNFLASELQKLYKVEKSFEGSDRLYAVGAELRNLLESIELFDRFEKLTLDRFRRNYREKRDQDKRHEFYLGKAKSLMQGMGNTSLLKFEEMLHSIKIETDEQNTPELLPSGQQLQ